MFTRRLRIDSAYSLLHCASTIVLNMRNFTRSQIKEIQKKFDLKGTEVVRVTRSFRVRVNLFLGCTVYK